MPFPLDKAPPVPMYWPTEVEKPRRNQTFITRSNSCDPTIRHHDRNTGVVALDAPIEKARGEV